MMSQASTTETLSSAERPTDFGPVAESQRILTLDVLRGFALLGILVVNIQYFSMPHGAAYGGFELLEEPPAEQLTWAAIRIFFQSKFIALFSMLFGIGLVLSLWRAEASGRPFVPNYLRRLAVLAGFGLVHALFVWDGDILFFYALLGITLLLFRNLRPKTLLVIATVLFVLGTMSISTWEVLNIWIDRYQAEWGEDATAFMPGEPADAERLPAWTAMYQAGFDPFHPTWQRAEYLAFQSGPFAEAFAFRVAIFTISLVSLPFTFGAGFWPFLILGMALMKLDFFRPERKPWHRWLAVFGLGIGLPLEVLSTWMIAPINYGSLAIYFQGQMLHPIASLLVTFGYLGLVTLAVSSGAFGFLATAFAAAGRMALSNYLLQSLVATGIMYWWGLGLFGQLGRPEQLALVLVIYTGQVIFSIAWLRWFRFGPFEWLWRSLTYLRLQPLLR